MQFFVMTGSTTSTRFKNLELELGTGKLPTPEKIALKFSASHFIYHFCTLSNIGDSKVSLLILILHCRILAFTRVNFSCNQSIFECSHFKNRYFISPMPTFSVLPTLTIVNCHLKEVGMHNL